MGPKATAARSYFGRPPAPRPHGYVVELKKIGSIIDAISRRHSHEDDPDPPSSTWKAETIALLRAVHGRLSEDIERRLLSDEAKSTGDEGTDDEGNGIGVDASDASVTPPNTLDAPDELEDL